MQENLKKDLLVNLYTSTIISGNYDCFRFDLTKFPQTYMASNKSLTLYMIGRTGKYEGSLGCSWATSIEGLSSYCQSSSMLRPIFDLRPIFVIEINDSQVLFEGRTSEHELVLKAGFIHNTLEFVEYEYAGTKFSVSSCNETRRKVVFIHTLYM